MLNKVTLQPSRTHVRRASVRVNTFLHKLWVEWETEQMRRGCCEDTFSSTCRGSWMSRVQRMSQRHGAWCPGSPKLP